VWNIFCIYLVDHLFSLEAEIPEKNVKQYLKTDRQCPFKEWKDTIKDITTKAIIAKYIDRLSLGNTSNCESVGAGVHELKIDHGPGFRVYFANNGAEIIILLCGGNKAGQKPKAGKTTLKKQKSIGEIIKSERDD